MHFSAPKEEQHVQIYISALLSTYYSIPFQVCMNYHGGQNVVNFLLNTSKQLKQCAGCSFYDTFVYRKNPHSLRAHETLGTHLKACHILENGNSNWLPVFLHYRQSISISILHLSLLLTFLICSDSFATSSTFLLRLYINLMVSFGMVLQILTLDFEENYLFEKVVLVKILLLVFVEWCAQ